MGSKISRIKSSTYHIYIDLQKKIERNNQTKKYLLTYLDNYEDRQQSLHRSYYARTAVLLRHSNSKTQGPKTIFISNRLNFNSVKPEYKFNLQNLQVMNSIQLRMYIIHDKLLIDKIIKFKYKKIAVKKKTANMTSLNIQ